jgi:hypothetical protein
VPSPPTRHRFQSSLTADFAAYLRSDAQARGVHLVQATPEEDRQFGIDDWLNLPLEGVVSVDWKTDHRAALTGNLAVEIIANASLGKLGWVFTSQADYIVYLLPLNGRLLWFKTAVLRTAAIEWQALYPVRGAHNDNRDDRFLYTTWNLTVPLAAAVLLADPDKPLSLLLPPLDCPCPSCSTARALPAAPDSDPPPYPLPLLTVSDTDLV